MFDGLFLSKATCERVKKILDTENFIYTDADLTSLLAGNQKGTRYGNRVLDRKEGQNQTSRFLKILIDGRRKTYVPFRRQIKIAEALHAEPNYIAPTMQVVARSLKRPVPYAVFETRDDGKDYGFMNDTPIYYNGFSVDEISRMVETIYSFHSAGANLQANTLKLAQKMPTSYRYYRKESLRFLKTRVFHKTTENTQSTEYVENLIAKYSGIDDLSSKTTTIIRKIWPHVILQVGDGIDYLVHADMQIDNIYRHANGAFELLDFEWVGRTRLPVIAIAYDYGNLRARAWSSPDFQQKLDTAMFQIGERIYQNKDLVQAGLRLGKLRSSLMMCRFHLDYTNTVKNDKRTDAEYFSMFPQSIKSFAETIQTL